MQVDIERLAGAPRSDLSKGNLNLQKPALLAIPFCDILTSQG